MTKSGEVATTYIVVSSVYMWMTPSLSLMISGKSLQYKENSVGPKTDPCGTPNFTERGLDLLFVNFRTNNC